MTIRRRATGVVAAALAVQITAGVAWSDPVDPGGPGEPGPAVDASPVVSQNGNPIADACARFDQVITIAALNYEDFAYATAGNGNQVDYSDPEVGRSNILGRNALRGAAAAALGTSRMPGLPPEVSDPMQAWSVHAAKLVVIMGLRRGGDSLNAAATQLNVDADNALMACAMNANRA